jgi:putative flippase GtrA
MYKCKSNIIRLLNIEFIRFVIVGIIATIIHYGIYYALHFIINVTISYTIGYIVSWCCNFFLTAKFTFKSQTSTKRGVGFAASHGLNYLLHIAFLDFFLHLGFSQEIAPLFVFCCVIPINFIMVRIVFKSKLFQK